MEQEENVTLLQNREKNKRARSFVVAGIVVVSGIVVVAVTLYFLLRPETKEYPEKPDELAKFVLSNTPLIDGHNDLAYTIRTEYDAQVMNIDLNANLSGTSDSSMTDIPRLRTGMLGGQFWSCYVSCSTQYTDAVRVSLDQCDVIRRFVLKYSDVFQFVDTASGIEDAFKSGRIASLIGLEGGHSIDSSIPTLRQFYRLGVRYMTLTHTCTTPWADSSPEDDSQSPGSRNGTHNGLTDFGKDVVKEMNRLGMLVDISHVSKNTMEDVLASTKAPVIFSHSSAWTLCHHHRNVQDDVLKKLKENNGIIMVNFSPDFINCPPNQQSVATLTQVADHIDHIRNITGIDHVGIGGDYNGINKAPAGLEDVSKYPALFTELARRGWTGPELEKLAGKNLVRVFRAVEEIRDSLRDAFPSELHIPEKDIPENTCRPDF